MGRIRASALLKTGWLLLSCLILACAAGRTRVQDESAEGGLEHGVPAHGLTADGERTLRPSAGQVVLASAPGGQGNSGSSHVRLWRRLTAARLVQLARQKGIGASGSLVERNRQIGRAFQGVVLRSINLPENVRPFPTTVRPRYASVIPDALLTARRLLLAGGISIDPEGAFVEVVDDSGFLDMVEVKVRSTPITLSTAQGQILGFIDVLGRKRQSGLSIAGESRPRPALLLITTADATVSETVTWEAARRGVAVYQAIPEEFEGQIDVEPFMQETKFADVPDQFLLPSVPRELSPEDR